MDQNALNELLVDAASFTLEDGRTALVSLAGRIWDEALDGEKYAIELVLAALSGQPTERQQQRLTEELRRMVELVYDGHPPAAVEEEDEDVPRSA